MDRRRVGHRRARGRPPATRTRHDVGGASAAWWPPVLISPVLPRASSRRSAARLATAWCAGTARDRSAGPHRGPAPPRARTGRRARPTGHTALTQRVYRTAHSSHASGRPMPVPTSFGRPHERAARPPRSQPPQVGDDHPAHRLRVGVRAHPLPRPRPAAERRRGATSPRPWSWAARSSSSPRSSRSTSTGRSASSSRQNKDLTATHAVSSAVRGGLSLPDLLEQSLDRVVTQTGALAGIVTIHGADDRRSRSAARPS